MAHAETDIVRKAIELLDRGENEQAVALLGPHAARHPDDVEALFRLAVGYARVQRLHDAVRLLGRVLEIAPGHGAALWSLGRAQLLLDNPGGAEPLLRQALSLEPGASELWSDHAVALSALGRLRDARRALEEASRRFPDDVVTKARLLALEIQDGAPDAAARTADRIEANHRDDSLANAAILQFCLDPPDADRARKAAARLWREQAASILDDDDLLCGVARAFPAPDRTILRSPEEATTCPACGAVTLRREVRGVILGPDPLERFSALGTWLAGNRCACGLFLPRTDRLDVLYPALSLAVRVDGWPREDLVVSEVVSLPAGHFDEPASARPHAEVWFALDVAGPGAYGMALEAEAAAMGRETSLPEIGELGRAERRAREAGSALRLSAGIAAGDEEDDDRPPLPDWMRLEREGILGSGIAAGPWPLDHRCACGADIRPFLFGSDRERTFDPSAIDDAAIAGRPFRDRSTGETVLGFNCDACGRLHTWILGIVPRRGSERP